jgi:hypothetical protein
LRDDAAKGGFLSREPGNSRPRYFSTGNDAKLPDGLVYWPLIDFIRNSATFKETVMTICGKWKPGAAIRGIALVLLCSAKVAFPQAPELPAFQKHPEQRAAVAEEIRQRRHREKTNAAVWAKAHGINVREEVDGRVRELMAVRNGKPIYYVTANANAAISTAADRVRQTAPFYASGAGVKVGIWDSGSVLSTHQEFGDRVTLRNAAQTSGHATHICGTIAAVGDDSSAMGMAPRVSVDSYDWNSDSSELASAAVSLSNHSYAYYVSGDSYYLFGLYTSDVQDMDLVLNGLQYCLPFAAAGNDRDDAPYKGGYDTISYLAIGKNVMAVGAVDDAVSGGVRSLGNATMTDFSNWGPSDDGRIKPDIVANGSDLYSCYAESSSSYKSISGTSMAAPNACGSAALLVEYYRSQTAGGAMLASTLKGLIIHTADDLGNPGPDYAYGWGLMNTLAAAALIKDCTGGNTNRMVESGLSTDCMSRTYTVACPGDAPLRVTLCWTDQPGLSEDYSDDDRNPDLVNDLNLKITAPNGTVFYPYKLSYSNPSAIATTDFKNAVDNVEQVYIESPSAGIYTITVDCDETLRTYNPSLDSYTFGGTQNYSLIVSGSSATDLDGDSLPNDWELRYFGSKTGAEASADPDNDGADNLTEYVAGTDPTDPDSLFRITPVSPPDGSGSPFVITWNSVTGRVYNVGWIDNLTNPAFTNNYSADLPYPANSYTDTVERTSEQNFYRVDVRLGE